MAPAGKITNSVVDEIYSVGPIVAGSGMNITVWSYVDQLSLSVLTDDRTLGDPHEATDALMNAFAEIRAAAGVGRRARRPQILCSGSSTTRRCANHCVCEDACACHEQGVCGLKQ